jgi:hypothetical protein
MTIKSNVGLGNIDILAADTSIIVPASPVERLVVVSLIVHNDAGATRTVEFYLSPDLTTASGDRIAYYSIADNESRHITEVIGQGLEVGENIIAIASATGLNAWPTVTNYDGGS